MSASSHPKESRPSVESVTAENALLREENQHLKDRIAWFERQVFGSKSEKRLIDNPQQVSLLTEPTETPTESGAKSKVSGYERGKGRKQRPDDCTTDSGLRFGDDVPVAVIPVVVPELTGPEADQYEVIDTKVTFKLAQRGAPYVVLRYEIPIIKRKDSQAVKTAAMPDQVLEHSIADVSLLAGLLVDKFQFHLPLHRQHQRMAQMGITVARSSLTNWVKRAIELLRPIVDEQCQHILLSKVLAMDETPIKAGRQSKGKLKQGYFWPLYGEEDEVVFTYSDSRGRRHIEQVLKSQFTGTLITDGYAAYSRYAETTQGITHAQCWVHSRRYFINAQERNPKASAEAIEQIGQLYQVEKAIRSNHLSGDKKQQYRLEHSKPIVDKLFDWCRQQCHRTDLTPTHPLSKALKYVMARENQLRVFLEDPDVPLDTNHLEREIRPIPLGRKNWLFCWTELGAEHVGIIQSLISTCKLHDINPYTYLVDVLQRISSHPANKIKELTPRLWKDQFADDPMRSPLDHIKEISDAD